MTIIFFDVGTVCAAIAVLMVAGMAEVTEIGAWLEANFQTIVVVFVLFAIIKAVFLSCAMKKTLFSGLICGAVDSLRMFPAVFFLKAILEAFADLGHMGLFDFIFGFISTIVGICITIVPMTALVLGTEGLCMGMMADESDGWIWRYSVVALLGTGLQFLFLKFFGMI